MSYDIVKLRVTSVSPILMHNPKLLMKAGGDTTLKRGSTNQQIDPPDIEARKGLYVLPDGQLYIPADAFKEAAKLAARDIDDPTVRGRRRSMQQRFSSSVFLSRERFPLFRPESNGDLGRPICADVDEWEIYVKRVVLKGNGVLRGRAKIDTWACDVEFEYDADTIDPNIVSTIVDQAGRWPGVLDFRVGRGGPFGRFTARLLD